MRPRAGTGKRIYGRRGEQGIALVLALLSMITLLLAAAAGLLVGSADVSAMRNYRGAGQVHFVAESGVSEALQTVNGPGVINFQNDVVSQWALLWGASTHGFSPLPGFSYVVTPVATAGNTANAGRLIATGSGIESVKNVVVANVVRSNIPSTAPGAIYLASDTATNATFNGDAFAVDGNDHNYPGGAGPGGPVPGLSTRNDANTQETLTSLSALQKDNVRGYGYSSGPPIVPSVNTSPAAPSTTLMNQMINDLLARPGVVTNNATQINGNATLGTTVAPQITHFTDPNGVTIKANGNASGAGIIIVEGDFTIQGNFDFKGLILVRGTTQVTEVTGNATIYGSLWTEDLRLTVSGSSITNYSTQALALANQVSGGGALPAPLRVTSLVDCSEVPSGSGGCP